MKCIKLEVSGFKRIEAVEITPQGNVVEITGKNMQGKSSVLDGMIAAIAGDKYAPLDPVKKGKEKASIIMDLGEFKIRRTFRDKEGKITSSLIVENRDGMRPSNPQALLNTFVSKIAINPIEFDRMKPKDQYDTLKSLVPNVDFAAIAERRQAAFDKRTDINRQMKSANSAIDAIKIPEGTPLDLIDSTALVAEMEAAGKKNAERERIKSDMENAGDHIKRLKTEAAVNRERAAVLIAEAEKKEQEAKETEEALAALTLPAAIDTTEISVKIMAANGTNEHVRQRQARDKLIEQRNKLEAEAEALTKAIEEADREKTDAIANAKLPVDGIDFGDGFVLLNGVPFEQASAAERLRASIAIAGAMNKKLRIIWIHDGSLIDTDGMKLVREYADKNDMQIWLERIVADGPGAFEIVDGHLKDAPKAQAAE